MKKQNKSMFITGIILIIISTISMILNLTQSSVPTTLGIIGIISIVVSKFRLFK